MGAPDFISDKDMEAMQGSGMPEFIPDSAFSTEPQFTGFGNLSQLMAAQSKPTQSWPDYLASAALKVADIPTLGLSEEIGAGGKALLDSLTGNDTFSSSYNKYLQAGKAGKKAFASENPVTNAALQLISAIALPEKLAMPLGNSVASASGFWPTVKALGTEGAKYGAAYGFGEGEGGLNNRLSSATEGALIGAPLSLGLGGGLIGGAKLLGGAGNLLSNAFISNDVAAGRKLLDAGGIDILNLPTAKANDSLYPFQTLAEATQSPSLAQLEQLVGKESPRFNDLSRINTLGRQSEQQNIIRALAENFPTTPEDSGQIIRQNLLEPKSQEAFDAARQIYQQINQNSASPFLATKRAINESIKEGYKAGGVPSSLAAIVGEVNNPSNVKSLDTVIAFQPHSYMQDLRERAQQAYVDLRNASDAKGAKIANEIVRHIDASIEAGPPKDVELFKAGKKAYANAMDIYKSGKVGEVLDTVKRGQYTIEDAKVLNKLWTGTPEGSRSIIKAIGDDPKAIEQMRAALRDKIVAETSDRNGNFAWTKFSDWLQKNKEALLAKHNNTSIFEPSHIDAMQKVLNDLELTAPSSAKSVGKLAYQASIGQPTTAQALIQAASSGYSKLLPGPLKGLAQVLTDNRNLKINNLIAEAIFDKNLAKILVSKATPNAVSTAASKVLDLTNRALLAGGNKASLLTGILAGALLSPDRSLTKYQSDLLATRTNNRATPEGLVSRFPTLEEAIQQYKAIPTRTKLPLAQSYGDNRPMDNVTQEKNPIVLESQDNILKQNTSAAPQDTFKDLVKSVIWQESRGNKDAVSEKGAKGMMQIMPATAKEIANKLGEKNYDLHDPATNIRFGSYYLKNMLDAFDGDVKLALAAYNFGIGRVKKLLTQNNADSYEQIESLLPQETRQYVPAILKRLNTKIDIVKV